mgnify:CR=1 FL=1
MGEVAVNAAESAYDLIAVSVLHPPPSPRPKGHVVCPSRSLHCADAAAAAATGQGVRCGACRAVAAAVHAAKAACPRALCASSRSRVTSSLSARVPPFVPSPTLPRSALAWKELVEKQQLLLSLTLHPFTPLHPACTRASWLPPALAGARGGAAAAHAGPVHQRQHKNHVLCQR